MDNGHTQHQKSTILHSGDQDEKEQEEKGEKLLNHDGQMGNNNFEGEPVDIVIDHENVSVVQDKKRTSVPIWRLVSVHEPLAT